MRSFLIALIVLLSCASAGVAQERRASHCIAVAAAAPGLKYLHSAAWQDPIPEYGLRISYLAHASFLLQTHGGMNIVTDYTGYAGFAGLIPDVVTMNHAHDTHWTAFPDPAIPVVLEGWGPFGQGIEHHLDLGEVLIRNVSTDIRAPFGGVEAKGNSIFVFEAAGLCVGHLGHLHHIPSDAQFAALSRLDVVMAPVDGGMTLPLAEMTEVLKRLKSSIVIPMHWFSDTSLQAFLIGIRDAFVIERVTTPDLLVSLRSLPSRPTVMVLQPLHMFELE